MKKMMILPLLALFITCEEPQSENEVNTYAVVLEVASEVELLIITFEKKTGEAFTDSIDVFPWSTSFTGDKGDEVSLAYQNNGTSGNVSISIKVDDVEMISSSCGGCVSETIGIELGWTAP